MSLTFIVRGLTAGDRCIYVASDTAAAELRSALSAAGVDVPLQERRGALQLLTARETYLRQGHFDPQAMVSLLQTAERDALADGFRGLRAAGEMSWALADPQDLELLVEYEALLNRFFPGSHAIAICQYDRNRFPPRMLGEILRAHPLAVLGGELCPNPFYEPPELVLGSPNESRRVDWLVGQLRQARLAEESHLRSESAARQSERELRRMLEVIPAAAYTCDADGRITAYNDRAVAAWGRAPRLNDDIDRYCGSWKLFTPDGQPVPHTECWMGLALKNSESYIGREIIVERPDGSRITVLAHATPFLDEQGKLTGAVNILVDISCRKAAEREREELLSRERAAREEAERTVRLKDEFLATLSHELRTPLNAILGYAQLLGAGALPESEVAEVLTVIERNARAQAQIIEDLLDLSRITAGKVRLEMVPCYLSDVVTAAAETVRPAADAKGVALRLAYEPMAGPVRGDPSRLQQIFWNLLNNAVKFTPAGGDVHVSIARRENSFEVTVTDSGQGIATEFLPFVFERFRQGDGTSSRRFGGLGIGLSLVKQLAELHGGSASVRSGGAGCGSSFAVTLPGDPLALSPDLLAPCRPIEIPVVDLGGVRVLLVDEDADSLALLSRILSRAGAEVTVAQSAEAALALLPQFRPQLLLTDLSMQNGYQLLQALRAMDDPGLRAMPAVALSAFASAEDRRRTLMSGFQAHLAKPISPAELLVLAASLAGRTC